MVMALRCVAVFFACAAFLTAGNLVETREISGENITGSGQVNANASTSVVQSVVNGFGIEESEKDGLLESGDVNSGLSRHNDRTGKRIYIPVTNNESDLSNRSFHPVTRLRKVDASMDFGPQKTFLEMAREYEDFSVKNVADPKSWVWDQLDQAYGFMSELVSEPSDLDEGRAKKKKKKILFFLIKLVIGLKVLLMGVLLPGVLTFTTVLSWKAVTLSILAFAFAKLGALKSMLKD